MLLFTTFYANLVIIYLFLFVIFLCNFTFILCASNFYFYVFPKRNIFSCLFIHFEFDCRPIFYCIHRFMFYNGLDFDISFFIKHYGNRNMLSNSMYRLYSCFRLWDSFYIEIGSNSVLDYYEYRKIFNNTLY